MSLITFFMMQRLMSENKKNSSNDIDMLIAPIAIAGTMAAVTGITVGLVSCQEKKNAKENQTEIVQEIDGPTKVYEEGEHVISIPLDISLTEAKRYEYHPGYKPIGITSDTYGKVSSKDAGSCVLYVNDLYQSMKYCRCLSYHSFEIKTCWPPKVKGSDLKRTHPSVPLLSVTSETYFFMNGFCDDRFISWKISRSATPLRSRQLQSEWMAGYWPPV